LGPSWDAESVFLRIVRRGKKLVNAAAPVRAKHRYGFANLSKLGRNESPDIPLSGANAAHSRAASGLVGRIALH
jgi:hypothetical protein